MRPAKIVPEPKVQVLKQIYVPKFLQNGVRQEALEGTQHRQLVRHEAELHLDETREHTMQTNGDQNGDSSKQIQPTVIVKAYNDQGTKEDQLILQIEETNMQNQVQPNGYVDVLDRQTSTDQVTSLAQNRFQILEVDVEDEERESQELHDRVLSFQSPIIYPKRKRKGQYGRLSFGDLPREEVVFLQEMKEF